MSASSKNTLSPSFAESQFQSGLNQYKRGKYSLAQDYFEAALCQNPNHPKAAGYIIECLIEREMVDKALSFAKAKYDDQSKHSFFIDCYLGALLTAEKHKKLFQIAGQFEALDEYNRSYDFNFYYGQALYETEQPEKALELFKHCARLEGDENIYNWIFDCLYDHHDYEALEAFMKKNLLHSTQDKFPADLRYQLLARYYYDWAEQQDAVAPEDSRQTFKLACKYIGDALFYAENFDVGEGEESAERLELIREELKLYQHEYDEKYREFKPPSDSFTTPEFLHDHDDTDDGLDDRPDPFDLNY